jgi:hypothetical protein
MFKFKIIQLRKLCKVENCSNFKIRKKFKFENYSNLELFRFRKKIGKKKNKKGKKEKRNRAAQHASRRLCSDPSAQTRPDGHGLPQSLNQGMSPVGRPVISFAYEKIGE